MMEQPKIVPSGQWVVTSNEGAAEHQHINTYFRLFHQTKLHHFHFLAAGYAYKVNPIGGVVKVELCLPGYQQRG